MVNLEEYKRMKPGKYWKLPKNKKDQIDKYLNHESYIPMVKYDGYWSRIIVEEDGILIQSRGISKVTGKYGEYQEKIPHIVDELKQVPTGTVLLGELHYPDLTKTLQDVGTILRCKPPKAVKRQERDDKKLMLSLFDILVFDGVEQLNAPFETRLELLSNVFKYYDTTYVQLASYRNPGSGEELLGKVWEAGGEGIILLKKDLPYNIGGAKAWHSIKVKRQLEDLEAPVESVIEPEEFYKGSELDSWKYWGFYRNKTLEMKMEAIGQDDAASKSRNLLKDYTLKPISKFKYYDWKKGIIVRYNNNLIRITSGVTEEDGQYLTTKEAEKLIESGQLYAIFTGMEVTQDSVRHPRVIRLRDDMNIE
jgi:hypothetical protein